MQETAKDLEHKKAQQWKLYGFILGTHKDLNRILFIDKKTPIQIDRHAHTHIAGVFKTISNRLQNTDERQLRKHYFTLERKAWVMS